MAPCGGYMYEHTQAVNDWNLCGNNIFNFPSYLQVANGLTQ